MSDYHHSNGRIYHRANYVLRLSCKCGWRGKRVKNIWGCPKCGQRPTVIGEERRA